MEAFQNSWDFWVGDVLLTEMFNFYVQDVTGRELAEYEIKDMTVPGMEGSYLLSKTLRAKPVTVKGILVYDSDEELREAYNELNGILSPKEALPVTFHDEPEFSYYLTYSGCEAEPPVRANQKVTLTFYRADPYKYGLSQKRKFTDDMLQVINTGTGPALPTIKVRPLEPVTHIDLFNQSDDGEQYMRIGEPQNVDDDPIPPKDDVITLNMASLAGWVPGTKVDDGVVSGTMKTKSGYFYTDDFGTGTRWHGPAEKYSLPYDVQDFELEVDMANIASSNDQIGRIEVALLDVNNDQVGKVMLTKYQQNSPRMYAVLQAGDSAENWKLINEHGERDYTWTQFDGRLKLSREGAMWKAWVGKWNEAVQEYRSRRSGEWEDTLAQFTNKVTQVQVYIAQYKDKPVTEMNCQHTDVDKYNDTSGGITYIADAGDEITFDHKSHNILINGVSIRDNPFISGNLKDFGAKYFSLVQGKNQLYAFPSNMEVELDYRLRYR